MTTYVSKFGHFDPVLLIGDYAGLATNARICEVIFGKEEVKYQVEYELANPGVFKDTHTRFKLVVKEDQLIHQYETDKSL